MLNSYKKSLKTLYIAGLTLLVSGCMTSPTIYQPFAARDINDNFESGYYIPKADTLYIVLDASASMNLPYLEGGYQGQPLPPDAPSRFGVGQQVIKRIANTLPELELKIAIRTFGYGSCLSWENTLLNHPMQDFALLDFDQAFTTIECASGGSPLDMALRQATVDLQNTESNHINVMIISDGEDFDDDPQPAIDELKAALGDKLCLDTVWVGEPDADDPSKPNLQALSDSVGCGQTYEAKDVASPKDMAILVRNAFMTTVDRDDDGVPDFMDDCAGSIPTGEGLNGQEVVGFNAC